MKVQIFRNIMAALLVLSMVSGLVPINPFGVGRVFAATTTFSSTVTNQQFFHRPWTPGDHTRTDVDWSATWFTEDILIANDPVAHPATNDNYNYITLDMFPAITGLYTINVDSATGLLTTGTAVGDISDTQIWIYQDSFDPNNPLTNVLAVNEDIDYEDDQQKPVNWLSCISNINFEANTKYILVVTTYTANTTGTVDFSVTGPGSVDVTDPQNPTAPEAPTNVIAVAGDSQATISFDPPLNDGGAAITSYTVTSNPGGISQSGLSSPITVTGLTNGTTYTFSVTATNSEGTSEPSSDSNAVTVSEPLSSDATLKSTAKIKGVTVTDFGTPAATIEGADVGSVTLTAVQGADTSNAGSYITSFVANDGAGTVSKIVKYSNGANTTNFDTTDTAYNGTAAVSNNDFFIVKVTAENTTVRYYKIIVSVNEPIINDISAAGVTGVTAPVAGATPAVEGSLTAGAETYTVTNLTWKNNDGTAATLTDEGKFKAGTVYKAEIELTSAAGNKFQAEGFTPTVNSGAAGEGMVSGGNVSGNKLTFTVTFDATEAQSVTGISVSTQPTKMSYTESTDAILALNGMIITETYNDGSTGTVNFTNGIAEGYTTSPANGATLTSATNNDIKVTITHTASTQTAQTDNLTVNPVPNTQATPSFSPASGAIAFGSTVSITSEGADHIYYTTDGTNPATSVGGSTQEYAAPVAVNGEITLKAIAVKAGSFDSAIGSASYTQAESADLTNIVLSGTPENFTFAEGTYTYNGVTVANGVSSITVTPSGAGTITVDGTTVTSGQASGAIVLTAGVEKTIVIVVTEAGKSSKTYTIKVTRETINAPGAPTIQSAVAGDSQVTINWSNVSGATGYKVYKSTTTGSYGSAIETVEGNVNSYNATGLTNGTTYYFVVKANNAGGDSINSNEVNATPQVAAPGAPVLQTAVAGNELVTLTWSEVAGSTGYKVYAKTSSGSYSAPSNTVAGSVYSCDVTGLTNGITYYFVVKASNPGGDSGNSNEVSAMPQVSVPAAPTGVTATAGNAKVTLNWNSVAGATGYKIYQATASGSYGSPLTAAAGSVHSYEATQLTNGTTYYFVIIATNEGGNSPDSAEVSAMPQTVPGAPTNVSATAGNGEATVKFTAPVDNGGRPITGYIVTASQGNITATGIGTTIKVAGLKNGTTYTFTVKAINAVGNGTDSAASNAVTPYRPSSGGQNGNTTPTTPTEPAKPTETGVEIQVNGKTETAATATTTKVEDKTVTTVTVDDKKVEEKLAKEGKNAVVTIPVKNDTDVVVGQLNGQTVKNMETKDAVLEVKTQNVTYTLPASEINIDAVSSQIGQQVELKDIKVNVTIATPPQDTVKVVENTASKNNYQLVVKPIDFEITCTSGNKTVDVSKFNGYVERMVAIPDGADPSKITTGIVLNGDGVFSHVPTSIIIIDGKYYAKINSLTNSTYSVIWSPKTFKDVENHWAKDAVNDMGSRLVISGVGEDRFEPDIDITRAEFAAIVVRALGLMRPGTGKDAFSDVTKDAWYYDVVSIANEYGIISGYGNGKFGPMDKITREQVMTMAATAMSITKLKAELKADEAKQLFEAFGDYKESSDWAKEYIAKCVNTGIVSGKGNKMIAPKENITRAEVAVIVRRLLQKSNLIN